MEIPCAWRVVTQKRETVLEQRTAGGSSLEQMPAWVGLEQAGTVMRPGPVAGSTGLGQAWSYYGMSMGPDR